MYESYLYLIITPPIQINAVLVNNTRYNRCFNATKYVNQFSLDMFTRFTYNLQLFNIEKRNSFHGYYA